MIGARFVPETLTKLTLKVDPFEGRLDLARLPALQSVCIHNPLPHRPFPRWMESQCIQYLEAESSAQFKERNLRNLWCLHLKISCSGKDLAWAMADLLLMPSLELFHLDYPSWHRDGRPPPASWRPGQPFTPILLDGTNREYQALLKRTQLLMDSPARLCVVDSEGCSSSVNLRRNGHTCVCSCPACCDTD